MMYNDGDLQSLPLDCLITVFSLLQDEDLIRVSTVCKEWYHAAETPWLWRRMCLQRWSFCNISQLLSGTDTHSWKGYYLRRSHLEMKMKSGRSCADYTCKSLRGHEGRVVGFAYLFGNSDCSDVWKCTPIVCSASTDGTVKAWDIQKGVNLWSSPAQSPLKGIVVDPTESVVVTSDSTGTIKTWKGSTGEEVASFESGFSKTTLLPFNDKGSSFLMVGAIQGLLVLTCPALSEVSRHVVSDSFCVDLLLSSPDKKWIFATSKENFDLSPKVFYSETVCYPVKNEDSLCETLPVSGCCAAVFLPCQHARLAMIHADGLSATTKVSIFDLTVKEFKFSQRKPQAQQVACFQIDVRHRSDLILDAKGSNTLLVTDGNCLKVYTLKGELVANFEEHIQPITALCVDSFRVVTASRDLSLRVLTWRNDEQHGLTLESQYHLLGGSHTMSRGFTNVACDYSSIVASVESVNGKDVLKAYTFDF